MSQTCMVPFASSPLRSLKEGHMQVMRTLRHWLPYHTLVDVHTKERKTLMAYCWLAFDVLRLVVLAYHWEQISPNTPILLHPERKANVPFCTRVSSGYTEKTCDGVRNYNGKHRLLSKQSQYISLDHLDFRGPTQTLRPRDISAEPVVHPPTLNEPVIIQRPTNSHGP